MNKLVLHLAANLDGECRMVGEIMSNGFSGTGSSCFDVEEVLNFAARLNGRSIPRDSPVLLEGGYWDNNGDLLETHFYLAAYAIDTLCGAGMKVRFCTPPHLHNREESQHRIEIELESDYQELANFGNQIRALVSGSQAEAVLVGRNGPYMT